jgi:hypothetical protein
MLPWFPLPSNLINKGEEWIPEVQLNATVCSPLSIRIEEVNERNNDRDKIFRKSLEFYLFIVV